MFFKGAVVTPFDSADDAQNALKAGEGDLVFGDGIGLTFWLNGVTSDGCCDFRGGPYLDAKYFGEGVDTDVAAAVDAALGEFRKLGATTIEVEAQARGTTGVVSLTVRVPSGWGSLTVRNLTTGSVTRRRRSSS